MSAIRKSPVHDVRVAMARAIPRGLYFGFRPLQTAEQVEHNAGAGLDGGDSVFNVGGTDHDAVSRSPWAVK